MHLRGDVNRILIGARSNLQDGSIVHVSPETWPTIVGEEVLIGHGVLLHGCTLHDRSYVGMRATLLNGVVVETGALVAAGAVVAEGTRIASGELWGGTPAREAAECRRRGDSAYAGRRAELHYARTRAPRHACSSEERAPMTRGATPKATRTNGGAPGMIETRALSLPSVLAQHAVWSPQAEAVVCGEERLSWGELVRRVHQVANALLRGGLAKGDRVATFSITRSNSWKDARHDLSGRCNRSLEQACKQRDAVQDGRRCRSHLPSRRQRRKRTCRPIRGSQGGIGQHRLVVIGEAGGGGRPIGRGATKPLKPHRILSTGSMIRSAFCTSGTTGSPKGMEHTHFSRLLYPLCLGPRFKIEASSRVILVTPMYHNGMWTTMLPALYFGACIVILERFRAQDFARIVEQERCTTAFMVPTQLNVMAALGDLNWSAFQSMRLIMVSGAPLSAQTFQEIRRRLPSLELCQIYGMGEGFMTFVSTEDYERGKDASVGRPMIEVDTDIQIIGDDDRPVSPYEVGEIVGTSAFLLRSYWANPELDRACDLAQRRGSILPSKRGSRSLR